MRLSRLKTDTEFTRQSLGAAETLLTHPVPPSIRPCSYCDLKCSCSGSTTCGCDCTPNCEHAAKMLTSDAENFPIEECVVPLVYAFSCLGYCQPFWSCEGHADENGFMKKPPRLWFYSREVLYPRLISDYLSNLYLKKSIHVPWHVVLTFSDADNPDTAFSMEPVVTEEAERKLIPYQTDVRVIAADLVVGVKSRAKNYITVASKVS